MGGTTGASALASLNTEVGADARHPGFSMNSLCSGWNRFFSEALFIRCVRLGPRKLITVSAESIFSKPLSKKQKAVLSRIAKRQAAGDDSDIDYSDIPPLTDECAARYMTYRVLSERTEYRRAHASDRR